ncbi:MAG: hypothetical protein ACLU4W_10670, partial [Acutalibacteraceae bacterium]
MIDTEAFLQSIVPAYRLSSRRILYTIHEALSILLILFFHFPLMTSTLKFDFEILRKESRILANAEQQHSGQSAEANRNKSSQKYARQGNGEVAAKKPYDQRLCQEIYPPQPMLFYILLGGKLRVHYECNLAPANHNAQQS